MLSSITVLLVMVLIFNVTLIDQAQKEVVFHQLKEAAEAKKKHELSRQNTKEEIEEVWVAHFKIKVDDGAYGLYSDRFTQNMYPQEIVNAIAAHVSTLRENQTEGSLLLEGKTYYYFVDWLEEREEGMVYFITPPPNRIISKEMLLFLMASIVIAFISSRLIALNIAKQVKGLDQFAEQIAKRNWEAEVPKTEQDEIGMLMHSLEKMRDALRAAEERDRQFLQSTSHDLKTPVMVIKGYAQAIIDGVDIEQENSTAKVILSESEKLEKRIVQLLRLNTLDQALGYTEEWDTVRLDRLIKSVVEKFRVLTPEIEWQLALEEKEIVGNSESLLIAFENIMDNQSRFAKSFVKVELVGNKILISNDGDLFNIENTENLFNPLIKDHNGKFGLGLAIVQKVVAGHGWRIKAYNLICGVCFEIEIDV
jgi:two-component system sensor histidine kinase CssS